MKNKIDKWKKMAFRGCTGIIISGFVFIIVFMFVWLLLIVLTPAQPQYKNKPNLQIKQMDMHSFLAIYTNKQSQT